MSQACHRLGLHPQSVGPFGSSTFTEVCTLSFCSRLEGVRRGVLRGRSSPYLGPGGAPSFSCGASPVSYRHIVATIEAVFSASPLVLVV